jgi:uncharacterized protein (TIGR02996 family)
MTATLRYDIGPAPAWAINYVAGDDLLISFGAQSRRRWSGSGKSARLVTTFAVKLPRQVGGAWQLYTAASELRTNGDTDLVRRGCCTLARNLYLSLGLPADFNYLDGESGFLIALAKEPEDLAHWSAYSDWLQERDEEQARRRGRLIAGWLGPKPIKVKYGIPVMALEGRA